jgi:hypothetical protein
MGFVYRYDQPLPDAVKATGLDWVGIEAYLDFPGHPVSDVNVAALNVYLTNAKAQVPAGKQIVLVIMAYDRNGSWSSWSNIDTLRDLQIPVYLQAYNDPRVVAITMFAYTRPGGSRDHQELRTPHRLIGERLLGLSVPLAGNGLRTLSVKAYDSAGNSVMDRVTLTIANLPSSDPPNAAPTIAPIINQITTQNTTLGPLPITLADLNNDVGSLIISASSSNQSLVPDANIILSGSGANRTLTITPAKVSINEPTDVTITVSVSDGAATTSTSFTLTVRPAGSDAFIYLPLIIRSEP